MKMINTIGAAAIALASTSASAAPTVNFAGGSGALPANATVFQDFEGFATNASIGTNAFALNGNSGNGARPAVGSTGNYGSILAGGTYTVSFAPTQVFSFVLGSLDTYNTLVLTFADNSTLTYSGGQIINDMSFPSGNQVSGQTNGVVSYDVGVGAKIVGASFRSGTNSFEVDNLAAAAGVPEPATWGLMILGFGMVGGALRRRSGKLATA